jgi:galactokinase
LTFVVAQSFVTSDKFVTGPIHYNLRVVECSMAAAYLNAVLNPPGTLLPSDASPLSTSLHGFHETYFALKEHSSGATSSKSVPDQLTELVDLVKQTLTKEEGYTREEVAAVLGIAVDELNAKFTSRFPVRAERFKLRQRALHCFNEALRVLEFMRHLETKPSEVDTTSYNERLGSFLDQSQASCRDIYECSCPEIDALCAIARKAGSYGSRVTGAGWGGCSVHLVPANKVTAVREAWEREYYSKLQLSEEQKEAAVVVSRPGSGSALYLVKGGVLA